MKTNKFRFIFFLLCAFYIYIYNVNVEVTRDTLSLIGGLGLIQFILTSFSWLKIGKKIISPYFIFVIVLYIFSFGQSLLYPFNLVCEDRDLFIKYSSMFNFTAKDIFLAQIQTLLMLNVFHIAGLRYAVKRSEKSVSDSNDELFDPEQMQRVKSIGVFLFVVSVIPYTYDTITDMVMSMTYGYSSLYGTTAKVGVDNIASFIAALFVPSVICLFVAYKDSPSIRRVLTSILLLIVLFTLITGGRSNAVILLCVLAVLYEYLVRPFSKKTMIIGIIGSFFFLQVLAYIANTRNISRSYDVEQNDYSDNAAVAAIAEMGWTQFCLIKCMNIVPKEEDYRYGKSYLYAFTSIVPNFGFWEYHPAKKESNLGEWLSETLGVSFGTGFSMCAEAWVNFGSFGFIIFYLWGALVGSLFGKIDEIIKTGNVALLVFLLIVFWFCLKIPRNAFLNIVRAIFFYAGPVYLYCVKFKLKNDQNKG